jgi:sulfotransferase
VKKIIFNSSLPRTGSTLLQNILAQNPALYASATSGVIELLYAARKNFTAATEFRLLGDHFYDDAWLSFCKHGLNGFYEGLTDKSVCVDKSRSWFHYYDWLTKFWPNPKIIVCIRDLRAILSSMEKLHRKNAHIDYASDVPDKMNFVTIEQRVAHWMTTQPVGLAVGRLRNAIQKGDDKMFLFVKYEDLVKDPGAVMAGLYDFIEEPKFEHNFSKIEQVLPENDSIHGIFGDHKIRPELVEVKPDWNETLGKMSELVVRNNKWFYDRFYPNV